MFPKKERRRKVEKVESVVPAPPPPTTSRSFKVVRRDSGPLGGQQPSGKVQMWAPGTSQEEGTGRSTGGGKDWRRFWKEEAQDCLGADQGPEEGGSV